ncbi:MAG: ribosomal L28e protein family-domain-containing protein [Linnemannia gamsii]|nr:MAG: ribosomal L28e protein family-domain-containing protein [Linnemannia gamsii]
MSADLTWLLIKNNNSFLIKRSGVQFSTEAGNLLNLNTFKYSGIANKKTIDISAAASGRGVVVATPKTKVTLTKGIRKSARSVAGLTRAGYRADLRQVCSLHLWLSFLMKRATGQLLRHTLSINEFFPIFKLGNIPSSFLSSHPFFTLPSF